MPHDHPHGVTGVGTARWQTPTTKPSGYGPDPSCQPCPECGGLECLCRPRFFAGQLLTEQDLNRLDHYITEKHKLHNRHLFGWGVVCGLEVRCDPCDERVTVMPGYALSPCGEDIVVCKTDSVDICDLIARCRVDDGPDCRPYAGKDDPCDNVIEEWVLAIRYLETPQRPTTPLTGGSSCACGSGGCKGKGCACGGSCGCSPASAAKGFRAPPTNQDQPRLRRAAPPTCEPTVTCESYRYDVFRKPPPKPKCDPQGNEDQQGVGVITASLAGFFESLDGDMAERIACCLRDFESVLPRPPGDFAAMTDADRQAWFRWICAVRQALAGYYGRMSGTDCEAMEKLGAIPLPDPTLALAAFKLALGQALLALLILGLEAMLNCLCSNMLPPCPSPEDPRVPLAVVKIRKRDCHIVSVCNWTLERRQVITFPTLGYWLGWIPLRQIISGFMEALCCQTFGLPDFFRPNRDVVGVQPGIFTHARRAEAGIPPAADPMAQPVPLAWDVGRLVDPVIAQALAMRVGAGGNLVSGDLYDLVFRRPAYARADGLDSNEQKALAGRLANSGLYKVFGNLLETAGGLFAPLAALQDGDPASDSRRDDDLAELKAAVAAQASEIEALKERIARGDTPNPKPRR